MKTQQKNVSWRRRCALGGDRSVLPAAVLGAALSVVGCDGGGLGGLAGLLGAIPSAEEIESAGRQFEQFNVLVDNLPSIAVRIVNNTDATAGINLVSGLTAPQPDAFLFDFGYFGEEAYLSTIDEQSVLIAPRGTATGTLKCGEVIGVSASAPFDEVFFDFNYGYGYGYGGGEFDLYVSSGNVQFDGSGTTGSNFEGDTITTVRFLRPDEDGFDCETDVLVIEINTAAVDVVVDQETGEVLQPKAPGSGTLSIEPAESEDG